jgi:hypothetical protein
LARIGPYISQHVPAHFLPPPPLPPLSWTDALAVLWVLVMGFIITRWLLRSYFEQPQQQWLLVGWGLKCLGSLLLTSLYYFHYAGGDMFRFHAHIDLLEDGFSRSWASGWQLMFREAYIDVQDFIEFEPKNPYFKFSDLVEDSGSYAVIRWGFILSFVCTKSIWALNMAFGLLAFWGSLLICQVLTRIAPNGFKVYYLMLFALPTSWIWANGMIKEALMTAFLGCTVWSIYQLFPSQHINQLRTSYQLLGYISLLIVSLGQLYFIKPYFAVALLPFLSLWRLSQWLKERKTTFPAMIQRNWTPTYWAALACVAITLFVLLQFSPYQLSAVLEHAEANRQWSFVVGGMPNATNSGYDIQPQFDNWWNGTIRGFKAIVYGLYAPIDSAFLSKENPLVWFFVAESTLLAIFSMLLLFRTRLRFVLYVFQEQPLLFWLIGFSLCYALWLGISVPFYGSLVRYRVMVVPFWMIGLWLLSQTTRERYSKRP